MQAIMDGGATIPATMAAIRIGLGLPERTDHVEHVLGVEVCMQGSGVTTIRTMMGYGMSGVQVCWLPAAVRSGRRGRRPAARGLALRQPDQVHVAVQFGARIRRPQAVHAAEFIPAQAVPGVQARGG